MGKSLFAPWLIDYEMVNVGLKKADAGLADVAVRGMEDFEQLRMVRLDSLLGTNVEFDPDPIAEKYRAGEPLEVLVAQGSAPKRASA